MAIVNFKQECNIPTFSRARKGWAKHITGLDKTKTNGYSFEGDFVSLGNFDTNLLNGVYLDCSKSADENGEIIKTYHIFSVEDGEISLLQTVEDCKGWAVKCWDSIDAYLNREGITSKELFNQVIEKTSDKKVLEGLIAEIQDSLGGDYDGQRPFFNEFHQKGIMKTMGYWEYDEWKYSHICEAKNEPTVYDSLEDGGVEPSFVVQRKDKNEIFPKDIRCIINALGWVYDERLDINDVWTGKIPIIVREIDAKMMRNKSHIFKKREYIRERCEGIAFYFDQGRSTINRENKHTYMVSFDTIENVIEVEHFYHYRDDAW
jgi:hypothetical protein